MYIFFYLLLVILANLTVAHFGPSAAPWVALLAIGPVLVLRDKLHDQWGAHLARNMLALIAAGGLASYLLNAGSDKVALASVVAFALSESADALAYHLARRKPFLLRSNASNVVGAVVDSVAFLGLAFGGLPTELVAKQVAAKVGGGFVAALVLKRGQK